MRTIKYKLDLIGMQVDRWKCDGTEPGGEYKFLMEKGLRIMTVVQVLLYMRESY
jgi:hypothetical protein